MAGIIGHIGICEENGHSIGMCPNLYQFNEEMKMKLIHNAHSLHQLSGWSPKEMNESKLSLLLVCVRELTKDISMICGMEVNQYFSCLDRFRILNNQLLEDKD
jgi:hypothetical protein